MREILLWRGLIVLIGQGIKYLKKLKRWIAESCSKKKGSAFYFTIIIHNSVHVILTTTNGQLGIYISYSYIIS